MSLLIEIDRSLSVNSCTGQLKTLKSQFKNIDIGLSAPMDITDFLQYPQYFSFFMIWASGYIFIYSIFRKSHAWKEFDSTIKVVLAFMAGFAIELCLILPFFYLTNMANLNTPIFLPAFDATWPYHWAVTGFVSIIFLKTRNKETLLKGMFGFFSRFLNLLFLGWSVV